MPLEKIDHYAIRTQRMDETKDFYEALGLHAGARPEFPFPGHWMYAGDTPVVHIVGIDTDEKVKKDKGNDRPINCLNDRIEMLNSIIYIDKVIPFDSILNKLIWRLLS